MITTQQLCLSRRLGFDIQLCSVESGQWIKLRSMPSTEQVLENSRKVYLPHSCSSCLLSLNFQTAVQEKELNLNSKGRKERKRASMTSPLKAVTLRAGVSLLVFVPPGGVSMCMLLTDLGQNTWQCCVTQPRPRSSDALQCFLFIFTCRKKEDLQMIVPFLICSG